MQSYGIRKVGPGSASCIYRSRELSTMDTFEAKMLGSLAVEVIYDLRKPSEVASRPTPQGLNAEAITFAVDVQDSPQHTAKDWDSSLVARYGRPGERMVAQYRKMAHHASFFAIILHMIAARGVPSLFHCVNGKDRAGVLSALILALAGLDRQAVLDDYLAANAWNAEQNERDLACRSVGRTPQEIEVIKALFEAREEYLDAFFDEVACLYGSFEHYCEKALKIRDEERDAFKGLLGLQS
ncbi:MAG: tyrosine-protein phosphatase [Coriobacteriaceae bacterium]|nr:tyrosine-protein phosphatase [Coriobacteriaceae bacterium]